MTLTFNPYTFRKQIPALSLEVNGNPAVFLDGPGGTQTPKSVIQAMSEYLTDKNSNLGGAFITSQRTDEVVIQARQAMADFFNTNRPEEIIFGQNMTSLTFSASRAISRSWQPGDEIIVTWLDHDANITPWVLAAEEQGVTVRWLPFRTEDCTIDLDQYAELLNDRTRLVAVTYASNAVGSMVDVGKLIKLAHRFNALVYVDAVHYCPHAPVDVKALDCDFLAASSYKFFGPHTGILYGKYEHLDELEVYKVRPAPKSPPGKWETGTQSFESLAGVRAAVDYLAQIGKALESEHQPDEDGLTGRSKQLKQAMKTIKGYEEKLSLQFLEGATTIPGLHVYGITDVERLDERVPTFAVSLAGYKARELAEALGTQGIFVWDGHYYAVAVMDRLGVLDSGGLVRIGFAHYNTDEEVDRTINTLKILAN